MDQWWRLDRPVLTTRYCLIWRKEAESAKTQFPIFSSMPASDAICWGGFPILIGLPLWASFLTTQPPIGNATLPFCHSQYDYAPFRTAVAKGLENPSADLLKPFNPTHWCQDASPCFFFLLFFFLSFLPSLVLWVPIQRQDGTRTQKQQYQQRQRPRKRGGHGPGGSRQPRRIW